MSSRTLGTRLRRVEQHVAREECAQYDHFLQGVLLALTSSLDESLTDHRLRERVRDRLCEILCPNHREKAEKHDRIPKGACRKQNEPMSEEQVRLALSFAGATRGDLVLQAIEPTLQALEQTLDELVRDRALRAQVLEDARTDFQRILDEVRPERQNTA